MKPIPGGPRVRERLSARAKKVRKENKQMKTHLNRFHSMSSKFAALAGLAMILLANPAGRVMAQPSAQPVPSVYHETYIDDWGFPVEVHIAGRSMYQQHADGGHKYILNVRITVTNLDTGKTVTVVSVGPLFANVDGSQPTFTAIGTVVLINGSGTTVAAGVQLQIGLVDPVILKIAGTTNTGDDVFSALVTALQ